jgi:hypothetical protein
MTHHVPAAIVFSPLVLYGLPCMGSPVPFFCRFYDQREVA